MKLDPKKFSEDERHANHMVQAFKYADCPLTPPNACFGIATGLGGAFAKICDLFDPENGECKKDILENPSA